MVAEVHKTSKKPAEHETRYRPLTAAEEEEAAKQLAEYERLFGRDGVGLYRVELMAVRYRRKDQPFPGMISIWERGSQLTEATMGKNMVQVGLCPGKSLGKNTCTGVIPDATNAEEFLLCPHCQTSWPPDAVITEQWFNLTVQNWATVIERVFIQTGFKADVVIKWYIDGGDIRRATLAQKEGDRWAKLLQTLRARRSSRIGVYSLKKIIKDTSAGATLYSRFRAFIEADPYTYKRKVDVHV